MKKLIELTGEIMFLENDDFSKEQKKMKSGCLMNISKSA